jgi:hypothetical protein
MSADSLTAGLVAWSLLLGFVGPAAAADDELPELDFLEYLGSWEESDEDWELFREFAVETAPDENEEQSETEAAGASDTAARESTES